MRRLVRARCLRRFGGCVWSACEFEIQLILKVPRSSDWRITAKERMKSKKNSTQK